MLILNHHLASQFHFPGGETPSGDQANAKTFNRVEGKVDTNTPDTNRPDDYTRQSNRQDLYQRAQKAVAELRTHGKDKEAHDLENSLQVAQEKEGLTIENSDKVKANYANRVNRLLREATSTIVGAKYGLEEPKPSPKEIVVPITITATPPPAKPAAELGITYTPEGRAVVLGGYKTAEAGPAPIVEGPTVPPKDDV